MSSRPDILAEQALRSGRIRVDPETGAIFKASGQRAEILDKRLGYGRVHVYSRPMTFAMAHRVVWISQFGLIPGSLQINHKNKVRWDNRIENLELVTRSGNVLHGLGRSYDSIDPQGRINPDWLNTLDKGEKEPSATSVYTTGSLVYAANRPARRKQVNRYR